MRIQSGILLVMLVTGAGCQSEGANRSASDTLVVQAFAGVPLLPGAGISDISGEGEAARATLHSTHPPDSAAAWYRRTLIIRGWNIVSDVTSGDSLTTIHANHGGRPLWIMFRKAHNSGGTVATVIGAVPRPDSN